MLRRPLLAVVAVVALAVPLLPAGVASAAPVPNPSADAFYAPPMPLPAVAPGTVLRSRTVAITEGGYGLKVQAWQLMYTSTDTHGAAVADVTTVLLPQGADSAPALVSYQPAEDSLALQCAPSYTLRAGSEKEESLVLAALENGWAVAVPDYEGLGSQWAAGRQEGHAVLDGVRAARSFAPLGLSTSAPVGLWGYSGGGQASAWAGELAPTYAPELPIAGIAEGGVPVNVADVAHKIDGGPFSGIYFGAAVGLSRAYPDQIDTYALLTPAGKKAFAQIGTECLVQFVAQYAFRKVESYTVNGIDPTTVPSIAAAIADDRLGQHVPTAPTYVYMAKYDELIPTVDVDALVANVYCPHGATIDYVHDLASDHNSFAVTGAAGAIGYLRDRFAGIPAPSTCASGPTEVVSTLASGPALTTLVTAITGLARFF